MVAPAGRRVAEDFGVQLEFADGSVGQILYTSLGDRSLPKERVEVHGGGASAVLDDWQDCRIMKAGGTRRVKESGKGHLQEAQALLDAVRAGGPSPIPMSVLSSVTRATIEAHPLLSGAQESPRS
jgi:polar amino acid transport system substrate-binding protein